MRLIIREIININLIFDIAPTELEKNYSVKSNNIHSKMLIELENRTSTFPLQIRSDSTYLLYLMLSKISIGSAYFYLYFGQYINIKSANQLMKRDAQL